MYLYCMCMSASTSLHALTYIIMFMQLIIQCNFSKPNSLGTKEMVQFREVSGLERFCMYSKYRERDLKTRPV